MFRSRNGSRGDYHDSMNHECFREWFEHQLLPHIPSRSLIIMDNATYHSKVMNKAPNRTSKKSDIIEWLREHNIPHDESHTKVELIHLVDLHKTVKKYVIDELAREHGHEVLRLPAYHCNLNPIELIWAQVKAEVRKRNSSHHQTLARINEITREAISHVTPENWRSCMRHVRDIEKDYWRKDIAVDHALESIIINLEDSSSEEDC